MYKVIYTPLAVEDLKSIYKYIAFFLKAPQTAQSQTNRIRHSIKALNEFPDRNKVVDWEPWKSLYMHQLPVDKYVVFYLVNKTDQTVKIVRIFYSGRNLEDIVANEVL